MDKYEIMLYPRAYRDIHDIYAYIALEKLSPETAKEQTDRIWQARKSICIDSAISGKADVNERVELLYKITFKNDSQI